MTERNYIRTEKELDLQLKGLIDIQSIFDSVKIKMFLSAGTMLGAIRNNDFIPWDWNVSVCCFMDLNSFEYLSLISQLEKLKFKIVKKNKKGYIGLSVYRDNIKFVIENLIIKDEWATRPYYKIPSKFVEKFEKVLLRGEYFLCPYPAIECVKWQYGENWKTPIKSISRYEVINPEHRINKRDNL